jgi:hypothetical protein
MSDRTLQQKDSLQNGSVMNSNSKRRNKIE